MRHPNHVFQQTRFPPTGPESLCVFPWRYSVRIILWSTLSSDLNSIEHLWDEIQRWLNQVVSRPTTPVELEEAFLRLWAQITNGFCEPPYTLHVPTVYDRREHPGRTYTVLNMSHPTGSMCWIHPPPVHTTMTHSLWLKRIWIIGFIRFIKIHFRLNEIKTFLSRFSVFKYSRVSLSQWVSTSTAWQSLHGYVCINIIIVFINLWQ